MSRDRERQQWKLLGQKSTSDDSDCGDTEEDEGMQQELLELSCSAQRLA